jgi:hypothetical protein
MSDEIKNVETKIAKAEPPTTKNYRAKSWIELRAVGFQ